MHNMPSYRVQTIQQIIAHNCHYNRNDQGNPNVAFSSFRIVFRMFFRLVNLNFGKQGFQVNVAVPMYLDRAIALRGLPRTLEISAQLTYN